MLDEKGNFPDIEKPMTVDALSCMASGLVGTSTSGAYIESATGIREGARTGLAAVTTALLFAVASVLTLVAIGTLIVKSKLETLVASSAPGASVSKGKHP